MNQDLDQRLGKLLREGAPPERDPAFRIRVLARRELHQYQQRQRRLILITAAALLAPILIYALVMELPAVSLLRGVLVLAAGAGLAASVLFSLRGLRQAARLMRGN